VIIYLHVAPFQAATPPRLETKSYGETARKCSL